MVIICNIEITGRMKDYLRNLQKEEKYITLLDTTHSILIFTSHKSNGYDERIDRDDVRIYVDRRHVPNHPFDNYKIDYSGNPGIRFFRMNKRL